MRTDRHNRLSNNNNNNNKKETKKKRKTTHKSVVIFLQSFETIKHGDLRREDTTDGRCVRRDEGPDRTVRAAILGCFKDNPRSYRPRPRVCVSKTSVRRTASMVVARRVASTGFADLLLHYSFHDAYPPVRHTSGRFRRDRDRRGSRRRRDTVQCRPTLRIPA